jgi:hypothetical protein
MVRLEDNGGSLKDGAQAFVLFLHGTQVVLRSSGCPHSTWSRWGECVNVTLGNAEIFRSVLQKGGRRICWWLAVLLRYPGLSHLRPPATAKKQLPLSNIYCDETALASRAKAELLNLAPQVLCQCSHPCKIAKTACWWRELVHALAAAYHISASALSALSWSVKA